MTYERWDDLDGDVAKMTEREFLDDVTSGKIQIMGDREELSPVEYMDRLVTAAFKHGVFAEWRDPESARRMLAATIKESE